MEVGCTHDFHFIMDRGMKDTLRDMEMFRECRGLSGFIVKILTIFAPIVKREHKWGEQRMSRYRSVCNDPDEIREHVHVYLPDKLYRELKLLHQDLNVYSIAQLLRGFLRWFLDFVDVYGNDVLRELEKLFDSWVGEEKQSRLTLCGYMRQLFRIIRHLPGKNRPITIYDSNFSPFWVMRI